MLRVPALGFMLGTLLFFSTSVSQASDPAGLCRSKQAKCAAKFIKSTLKCHAKAHKAGVEVDAECLEKADTKFTGEPKGCVAKAEAKGGCEESDRAATMLHDLDDFIGDVVPGLDPNAPLGVLEGSICASKKHGCVAKFASGLLKCHAKAAKKGIAVDPECLQKAEDRFDGGTNALKGCFAKLEAKGGCLTTGDTAAQQALAEGIVADSLCEIEPATCPPTTTTTSTTSTTIVSGPCLVGTPWTVIDTCTGLEWEKKSTAVDSGADYDNYNDVDNRYPWAGTCETSGALCQPTPSAADRCTTATGGALGCALCDLADGPCSAPSSGNGTTVWQWLALLNATAFDGNEDWRLPTSGGALPLYASGEPAELESIRVGATTPTIDPIFGPTAASGLDYYLSATTRNVPVQDTVAWAVVFDAGAPGPVGAVLKDNSGSVRAVRGGNVCSVPGDCASLVCGVSGVCHPASCSDAVANQGESDIDCGGTNCPGCVVGQACAAGGDCGSGVCSGGTCQVPTCSDLTKNGDETAIDCGGSCAGCSPTQPCVVDTDCVSNSCDAGVCVPPTCDDGSQNGGETGVDCGGLCADGCLAGEGCGVAADCASGVCASGTCQAASCVDSVKNGDETDEDCGGSCPRCEVGEACASHSDCGSLWCAEGTCGCRYAELEVGQTAVGSGGLAQDLQWPGGNHTETHRPGCSVTVSRPGGFVWATGNDYGIVDVTGWSYCLFSSAPPGRGYEKHFGLDVVTSWWDLPGNDRWVYLGLATALGETRVLICSP